MARYKFMVLSNPVAGQDQEFNSWYDEQHVPDVLTQEAIVSAQRFRLVNMDGTTNTWRYLVVYEMETDDPAAVLAAGGEKMASGEFRMSPAMDIQNSAMMIFEPITEVVSR